MWNLSSLNFEASKSIIEATIKVVVDKEVVALPKKRKVEKDLNIKGKSLNDQPEEVEVDSNVVLSSDKIEILSWGKIVDEN